MLFRSLVRGLIGNVLGTCCLVACLNVSGVEDLHGSADSSRRYQTGAVSVIIPTFNNGPYIEQCVRSVMAQTYKNLEILGINDASTDETEKIMVRLAQEDSRIRVISITPNEGLSHARNVGMDNAHGEFIYFLDGDDWISNEFVENLLSVLVQSGCEIARISLKEESFKEVAVHGVPSSFGYIADINDLNCCPGFPWKYLYRHDFLSRYNLRFDERLSRHEDQPWTMETQVYARYTAICAKNACVYHRTNPRPSTKIPRRFDVKTEKDFLVDRVKDFAQKQKVEHLPFVQRCIKHAESMIN